MIKIAIVGSRKFNDYETLKTFVDKIIAEIYDNEITIISGGAKGTDKLAEIYASEKGYEILVFKPNWKKFGRGAGLLRNKQIVENSDIIIAFWHKDSKGTKNTINLAKKNGKKIFIYDIETNTFTNLKK